jgi:UrcA family protein
MTHLPFSFRSRRYLVRCATALSVCALGGTVSAADAVTSADSPPSLVIKYNTLDLSNEQGAVALYRRIAAAAQQVCPPENLHDLGALARSHACQAKAIARAVRAVDNPWLATVQTTRSSKSVSMRSKPA